MAYFKKTRKEPYLTASDKARIAAMDNNPTVLHRKNKVGITLKHPNIAAVIYIICYGKDKDELKATIESHVNFFKNADKQWKLISAVDLKAKEAKNDSDLV